MPTTENFMNWTNPGTALITGGSAGLGAEFARQLAAQGFDLVLVARRQDRLAALAEELMRELSVKAETLVADHSVAEDNERVMQRILACADLDVLVNNAGYGLMEAFGDSSAQDHVDMITVHCTAPTQLAHSALAGMRQRGRGVIINVSSIAAFLKAPPGVMYATTKEYVNVFSETLQGGLADTAIRVQSLCPGFTYTEFHDVEGMAGFDRNWFPEEAWMTASEVVACSLEAFEKPDVLVIPGKYNQDLVLQSLAANPRFQHLTG